MLNNICLQGRMTRDCNMRYSNSGDAVVNITLAVERNYKNSEGDRDVDFIKCVAWRKTAELIAEYFHKGDMIIVEGEIRQNKWQDKDDNNRSDLEINVSGFQFVPNGNNKPAVKKKDDTKTEPTDEDLENEDSDFDVPF
jgi:single-strand DNA-binding protein